MIKVAPENWIPLNTYPLIQSAGWCDIGQSLPPYEQSYTRFVARVQRARFQNDPHHVEVQVNRRGNPDFYLHHVRWDDDAASLPTSRFVQSLRPGDTVQLYALAHFPGWVNIVGAAEIRIRYGLTEGIPQVPIPHLMGPDLYSSTFYRTLDPAADEIRLLEVHPGPFDEPIYCSLVRCSLSQVVRKPFEALSYCWGNATERTFIWLCDSSDGGQGPPRQFSLAQSAESAIRRFRHGNVRNGKRTLWVDAICINQSDLEERARQVSMIAKIYSMASQVNIWLGEEYPGSMQAMQMVRDIYNSRHHICPGGADCLCTMTRHVIAPSKEDRLDGGYRNIDELYNDYANEFADLSSTFPTFFHAMTALLGNPWFRRVWVFQEVLGSKAVMIHCGPEIIPWIELVESNEHMDRNLYFDHKSPPAVMPTLWTRLAREKLEKDANISLPSILDVCVEALDLEASDPRDKIYALISFGSETSSTSHAELPDRIRPDYRKSQERTFADFTRWWILEHKSLRILSTIHGQRGRSWQSLHCPITPAYSYPSPTWTVGHEGSSHWARATLQGQLQYRAAGDTVINPDPVLRNEDPLILSLEGWRATKIRQIGHFSIDQLQSRCPGLVEAFLTIFDPAAEKCTWRNQRKNLKEGGPVRINDSILHRLDHHQSAHWGYGPRPSISVMKFQETAHDSHHTETQHGTDMPSCIDPCFFVGFQGEYGLCPSMAKPGDTVVILKGGNVPFILRQQRDNAADYHFELVGECFLHGAMNGEFVQRQAEKSVAPEVFALV